MYVTPTPDFRESLVFLKCAREALADIVAESSVDHKDELCAYLVNEASDYEIMSLLVEEEMPDEKFNLQHEMILFATLKEQMIATPGLPEFLGEDIFNKVMLEVDTLSPFQSAPVLMERLAEHLLNEESPTWTAAKKTLGTAGKFWTKAGKKAGEELAKGGKALGKGAAKAGKELGTTVGKGMEKGTKWVAGKTDTGVTAVKKGLAKSFARPKPGEGAKAVEKTRQMWQKSFARPKPGEGAKAVGKFARPKTIMPQDISTLKTAAKQSKVAAAGPSPLTANAGTAKWWLTKAKGAAKGAKDAVTTFAKSPAGKAVGGAALAALAIYGGHKLYKNYLSKAAQACRGTGAAKDQCMNQYKARALGAEIKDLNAAKAACKSTKDPAKCASAIQGKISRLQVKQSKLKG